MYKDIYSFIIYNDKKLESTSNRKVAKYGMAIWGNSMQHENDDHEDWEDREIKWVEQNYLQTKYYYYLYILC